MRLNTPSALNVCKQASTTASHSRTGFEAKLTEGDFLNSECQYRRAIPRLAPGIYIAIGAFAQPAYKTLVKRTTDPAAAIRESTGLFVASGNDLDTACSNEATCY